MDLPDTITHAQVLQALAVLAPSIDAMDRITMVTITPTSIDITERSNRYTSTTHTIHIR
jgi:hypothetical protein